MNWEQLLVTCGGLMASAFALARLSMVGRFKLMEQMLGMVESSLARQEKTAERLSESVSCLRESLAETTAILRRFHDRK